MSDSKRTKILAGVLAVFAVLFLWRQLGGGSDATSRDGARASSRNRSTSGRRASAATRPAGEVVPFDLGRLEHQPAEYSPGRDLFQYYTPPPPTVKRPPRPVAPKQTKPRQVERPTSRKPPRPKPPRFDMEYLGSFGPEGRRIAVFSDKEDILNAIEGDVLNDQFIVGPIGYESVEMGFVGFPDEPPKRVGLDG